MRDVEPDPPSFKMQRMFPDTPVGLDQYHPDDQEESLPGPQFIQAVTTKKKKPVRQTRPSSCANNIHVDGPHIKDMPHRDEDTSHRDEDSSHNEDMSHRDEDMPNQGDDRSHRNEDMSNQCEDRPQRGEDMSNQGEDMSHRDGDRSNQGEERSHQGEVRSHEGEDRPHGKDSLRYKNRVETHTNQSVTRRKHGSSARKHTKKQSVSHSDDTVKFSNNPAFENVYLSRPSTPQPQECEAGVQPLGGKADEYRIKYLTVRIEQQMEHVRRVLETMVTHKAEKIRISSMLKVKDALALLKTQLLGILVNNPSIMKMFESRSDVEEFFGAVEGICSSIEEVPLEGHDQARGLEHVMKMEFLGHNRNIKDGKTRIKKSKKSLHNTKDVKTLFKEGEQLAENAAPTNRNNSMDNNSDIELLARGKLKPNKGKALGDEDNGSISFVMRRSQAPGWTDAKPPVPRQRTEPSHTYTSKTSPPRDTDGDNDVTTSHSGRYASKTAGDKAELNKKGKGGKSLAEARRDLYRNARLKQTKGIYPCTDVCENWSDTDPEEEDLLADIGSQWPKLDAKEREKREKEAEYESLMDEIDALMAETKITNKCSTSGISFEQLMMGNTGHSKRDKDDIKQHEVTMTKLTPGAHVTSSKTSEIKGHKNSDKFIDDLDHLLSECENLK